MGLLAGIGLRRLRIVAAKVRDCSQLSSEALAVAKERLVMLLKLVVRPDEVQGLGLKVQGTKFIVTEETEGHPVIASG